MLASVPIEQGQITMPPASDDPDVIWVQDLWTDQAAHEAAMSTEEMSGYVKQAMPLLAGMPQQIEVEPSGGKYPAG